MNEEIPLWKDILAMFKAGEFTPKDDKVYKFYWTEDMRQEDKVTFAYGEFLGKCLRMNDEIAAERQKIFERVTNKFPKSHDYPHRQ